MFMFIVLPVILIFLLYYYYTRNDRHWEKLGVPFEKPKFFFGNLKDTFTGTKNIGVTYKDLYDKHLGVPYIGIFKMATPAIIVKDVDLIKDVLIKDFNNFADNDFNLDPVLDPQFAVNPFVRTGASWKVSRAQWSSSMTGARLRCVHAAMPKRADLLLKYIEDRSKQGPINSRELSLRYLTDVIVTSVFALENDAFQDDKNLYKKIASDFFQSSFWDNLLFLSLIVAPFLVKYLKIRIVSLETQKDLMSIAKTIIENRKKYGFVPNDFFEVLISKTEYENENAMLNEISGRVFGFLVDGIETSSGVIDFTLFELASHPEIQKRVREEIEKTASAHDGELTFEDLQALPYLDMVISEVLRLYPPALALHRVCTRESQLGALLVQPGTTTIIPVYALHHDPALFPDPETFNPERFAPDAPPIPKCAYMPFGEGPRICLGSRLGLIQTKAGVTSIIRKFNVGVSDRTSPRPLSIDPTVFIARAVGGLWLTFDKLE